MGDQAPRPARLKPGIDVDELLIKIVTATEFWSAIVGAIVGGSIALLAQALSLRAQRKQREVEFKRARQTLGNSLLLKMSRIYTNIVHMHQHIEDACNLAKEKNLKGELWQFVTPLANPPPPVRFTHDEICMLWEQKDSDVLNAVISLDEVHNGMLDNLRLYIEHWLELTRRLPVPDIAQGALFSSSLTAQQVNELRPAMVIVNSLIEQLRESAAKEVVAFPTVHNRLQNLLHERFGTMKFELNPPDQRAGENGTSKAQSQRHSEADS